MDDDFGFSEEETHLGIHLRKPSPTAGTLLSREQDNALTPLNIHSVSQPDRFQSVDPRRTSPPTISYDLKTTVINVLFPGAAMIINVLLSEAETPLGPDPDNHSNRNSLGHKHLGFVHLLFMYLRICDICVHMLCIVPFMGT